MIWPAREEFSEDRVVVETQSTMRVYIYISGGWFAFVIQCFSSSQNQECALFSLSVLKFVAICGLMYGVNFGEAAGST